MVVMEFFILCFLNRDRRFNRCVGVVVFKLKIIKLIVKNRCGCAFDDERGKRQWLTGELGVYLLKMVVVQVAVAACPDELFGDQARLLRNHVREQGVGSNVEWHTEENIGAALVQLAR